MCKGTKKNPEKNISLDILIKKAATKTFFGKKCVSLQKNCDKHQRLQLKTINTKMKLRLLLFASIFMMMAMLSCNKNKQENSNIITQADASSFIKGDSMIYGLACDGTSDSTIIVYPFDGGDPVAYSCIDASQKHRIIGTPQIGDWVGLILDKEDKTIATMVVNLDQLKGTWTYPVMPTLKDFEHLSKRMQKRMQREALENMPDSIKNLYFIPREYGFTLKRSHVAQAVGRIFSGSSIEDDSPVKYPEVKAYQQWFSWNGKLILVSTNRNRINIGEDKSKEMEFSFDTLSFISMTNDSLILEQNGVRYGFHRKGSTIEANALATQKAQEADKKAAENLK